MIMPAANRRRWFALALLCAASFMTVLDGSIVNVALPEIGRELHFSAGGLQWVVTGYALSFGGFLLLAGRAGTCSGTGDYSSPASPSSRSRRSPAASPNPRRSSILGRLAQGLGGALLSPAALALVATTFADGPERHRALGIYGGLAALGFATGVLLGGLLTDRLGWRVFFVNLPVGALALARAPRLLEARRGAPAAGGGIDVIGAVIVTAALAALVYGVAGGAEAGPGAARTLAPLGLAALLAAGFVAHERRTPAPLVRLGIFRRRTLAGANLLGLVLPGTFVAALFLLTLYLQGALDYTPIRTGLAFLPMAAAVIVRPPARGSSPCRAPAAADERDGDHGARPAPPRTPPRGRHLPARPAAGDARRGAGVWGRHEHGPHRSGGGGGRRGAGLAAGSSAPPPSSARRWWWRSSRRSPPGRPGWRVGRRPRRRAR